MRFAPSSERMRPLSDNDDDDDATFIALVACSCTGARVLWAKPLRWHFIADTHIWRQNYEAAPCPFFAEQHEMNRTVTIEISCKMDERSETLQFGTTYGLITAGSKGGGRHLLEQEHLRATRRTWRSI